MERKSALITNLYLASRTGSELHALEVARGLVRRGWEVTCYALIVGEPLRSQFLSLGPSAHLVEFGNEDFLLHRYDLLYAQHHVVSDYVVSNLGISFGHIVVSILGATNENEVLPDLTPSCDCVAFVSEEAREARAMDLATLCPCPPTFIFPNYATEAFFKRFDAARHAEMQPSCVAVISNHVPSEVRELSDNLCKRGIACKIYGAEAVSVDVTPELLSSFDVIVTIGRTVQQCLACGTAVFCYDQFGGPGYLAPDNLDEHSQANFSGRSYPVRRSAAELEHELLEGFAAAMAERCALHALARERYDFDALLDGLLEMALCGRESAESAPIAPTRARCEKNRMLATYLRDVIDLNGYGVAQFFWGMELGDVSAERSAFVHYQYGCEVSIPLSMIPEPYRLVRFDPDDVACVCRMSTEGLEPARPHRETAEGTLFVVDDPFYVAAGECRASEVVFTVWPVNRLALLEEQSRLVDDLERRLERGSILPWVAFAARAKRLLKGRGK